MSIVEKQEIVLQGNELAWLIRLAEAHYTSDEFQKWLSEKTSVTLKTFLEDVLSRFHPSNFYAGKSKNLWRLTNDISKQRGENLDEV